MKLARGLGDQDGGLPAGGRVSWRTVRKNLGVVSVAYGAGALAGFAAQTVLARRLGSSVFGAYVAAVSLVTILSVLDELGGTGFLVKEGAREPARVGLLLGEILPLKIAINVAVVGLAVASALALGLGRTEVAVAALLAAMFGANALARSLRGGLQAIERLGIGSIISTANALLSAAGMIAVVLAGGGLVLAVAISAALSGVTLVASWAVVHRLLPFRLRVSREAFLRVFRQSLPFAVVAVLTFAMDYADAVVVRVSLGTRDAGLYGAAYRVLVVLQFLPSIYLDAVYRTMSHLAHRAAADFGRFVDRSAAGLFLLALPFAVGGTVVGGRILVLIFGAGFAPGGDAFRVLLWSLPFTFPTWILLSAVVVGDRPQTAGWIVGAGFILNVVTNLVLVPRFGFIAAAWTTVGTELLLCTAATVALARQDIAVRWPRMAVPGVVAAGALAAVVFPLRHLPLAVPVVAGAVVYFAALVSMRVPARLGIRVRTWSEPSTAAARTEG